jgi:hypothetical protein
MYFSAYKYCTEFGARLNMGPTGFRSEFGLRWVLKTDTQHGLSFRTLKTQPNLA